MNREEELRRLYEDRDMLETDIDLANEEMRWMTEDSDEWNDQYDYITGMENEVMYLNASIESIESGHED